MTLAQYDMNHTKTSWREHIVIENERIKSKTKESKKSQSCVIVTPTTLMHLIFCTSFRFQWDQKLMRIWSLTIRPEIFRHYNPGSNMVHSLTTKILLSNGMIYCIVRPIKSEDPSPDNAEDRMTAKLDSDSDYVIKGIMNRFNSWISLRKIYVSRIRLLARTGEYSKCYVAVKQVGPKLCQQPI